MEALGSLALGGMTLFGYNRKNFLYDRKMRQEQEFTIAEMRLKQADLWREDVRDISELTQRKMDTYLIVNALLLGFTITMFVEGRLVQGTPQWLLWLYMLSLSGSFMFLLLSVWLSMHASIVAQASSVRLLTQLVRPPIPSWEQLESMRTYASAFEGVPATQIFRVPILQTMRDGAQTGSRGKSCDHEAEPGTGAGDPWGLERRGDDIYELARRPLTNARHVKLLQEASRHWQCYDSFARASMSLGTIMICTALGYFIVGYALINDGAPWVAWAGTAALVGVGVAILRADTSTMNGEFTRCSFYLVGGPSVACMAGADWATWYVPAQHLAMVILPMAYLFHGLFLLTYLRVCRVTEQPSGGMMPIGLQGVLYTDIFGWLVHGKGKPLSTTSSPKDQDGTPNDNLYIDAETSSTCLPDLLCEESPVKEPAATETSTSNTRFIDLLGDCREQSFAGNGGDSAKESIPKANLLDACFTPTNGNGERDVVEPAESSPAIRRLATGEGGVRLPDTPSKKLQCVSFMDQVTSQVDDECEDGSTLFIGSGLSTPTGLPRSFGPGSNSSPSRQTSRNAFKKQMRRRSISAVSALNFPRRLDVSRPSTLFDVSRPMALRPEDVETTSAEMMVGCSSDEDEEDENVRFCLSSPSSPTRRARGTMPGVGPTGVIPAATPDTFKADSYVTMREEKDVDESEITTGRDCMDAGQLPWRVFQTGVRFLSGLWFAGFIWAAAQAVGVPDIPDKVLPASVHVSGHRSPVGAEEKFHGGLFDSNADVLLPGSPVYAQWPSERFFPRGLSSNPPGTVFAVADEFAIYVTKLVKTASSDGKPPSYRLSEFKRSPHCPALDGQAIRDVAVQCARPVSGRHTEGSCRALALHARGRRIADCPLIPEEFESSDASSKRALGDGVEAGRGHPPLKIDSVVAPKTAKKNQVWTISNKWLREFSHGELEEVISIVVDTDCTRPTSLDGNGSCVVVGTSHGRMIELRPHMRLDGELVPAGALWNVLGKAALKAQVQGPATSLLTAIPGGIVLALKEGQRNLHAINVDKRHVIGKWQVPQLKGRTWTAITVSGKHLYLANHGGACMDQSRWIDTKGFGCASYVDSKWCTIAGRYGEGWYALWGTFERYSHSGKTALDMCCGCGGGVRVESKPEFWRFPLPTSLRVADIGKV